MLRLGVGLLRAVCLLPYRMQVRLGRGIGRLSMGLGKTRRHVVRVNLALCFPELSAAERARLLREHFESLGIALFETALAWWAPDHRLGPLAHISGMEHLTSAHRAGKGVILVGGHFTCVEIAGRLMARHVPLQTLYRPHNDANLEKLHQRNRERLYQGSIPRHDIRAMVRSLRRGEIVWYAPDQNHRGKHSVFVPFFGVPASTNTSTSRLAELTGAAVVPVFFRRSARGYEIDVLPPLADFPSDDVAADTAGYNRLLEQYVRLAPAQYLWSHRRFKDQPRGMPNPYDVPTEHA